MMAMIELGEYILELRKARNLSQRELGEKAGVAGSTISFIERGVTENPDPATLIALADALGADQQALLELAGIIPRGEDDEPPDSELTMIMEDLKQLRGTPLYHPALHAIQQVIVVLLYKLDPPPPPPGPEK